MEAHSSKEPDGGLGSVSTVADTGSAKAVIAVAAGDSRILRMTLTARPAHACGALLVRCLWLLIFELIFFLSLFFCAYLCFVILLREEERPRRLLE